MLKRDTSFVIGAGASRDLGFPLGDTLRDKIISLLRVEDPNTSINFSDPTLAKVIARRAESERGSAWPERVEAYRRAAAIICAGLPFARSIDTFLDGLRDQPDIEFLGKLAIATIILRTEQASALSFRPVSAANAREIAEARLKELVSSWHVSLGQILYEGHTLETLGTVFDHASFIVFNYDRCIEEFLTISLMRRFAIERSEAMALVARCRIIHPYGQVGSFLPNDAGHIAFGNFQDHQLAEVAASVRTFTEAMEESVGDKVKDMVARADVLVFMGFGWLPQNMQLLQVGDRVTNAHQVFATTMDMAFGEVRIVEQQVDKILRRKDYSPEYDERPADPAEFIVEQGDCKALMKNCWLRLTSD